MSKGEEIKLAILGATRVGKSCICYQFFHKKKPSDVYRPTLSVDLFIRVIANHPLISRLAVFDVSVFPQLYTRSHCVAVVYDVTSKESFVNAETLLELLENNPFANRVKILVGNKCCSQTREVTTQEGVDAAIKWKSKFIETDALENVNVEPVFWTLVKDYCDSVEQIVNSSYEPARVQEITENEEVFRHATGEDDDEFSQLHPKNSPPTETENCCSCVLL